MHSIKSSNPSSEAQVQEIASIFFVPDPHWSCSGFLLYTLVGLFHQSDPTCSQPQNKKVGPMAQAESRTNQIKQNLEYSIIVNYIHHLSPAKADDQRPCPQHKQSQEKQLCSCPTSFCHKCALDVHEPLVPLWLPSRAALHNCSLEEVVESQRKALDATIATT